MKRERGFVLVFLAYACACGPPAPAPVATQTANQVLARLPAPLRERFDSPAGQRELTRALDDKALLVAEARRRGFAERPDVHAAVTQLEDKLIVQALVKEEQGTLRATAEEINAYYSEHLDTYRQTERVGLKRLFAEARSDKTEALARAKRWVNDLRNGASWESLVGQSDGPERVRGGDYGAVAKDDADTALAAAAFAATVNVPTGPVETAGGFSVVVVTQRFPARVRPLEEVRADVENRLQPMLERRAFESVLKRLRTQAEEPR